MEEVTKKSVAGLTPDGVPVSANMEFGEDGRLLTMDVGTGEHFAPGEGAAALTDGPAEYLEQTTERGLRL